MIRSGIDNPAQGFCTDKILTGVTTLALARPIDGSTSSIAGIRIDTDSEYYLNSETGDAAIMPAGVTVFDPSYVTSITFAVARAVEVMYRA